MKAVLLLLALWAPVQHLDSAVRDAVQAWRPTELERPMRWASDIGNPKIVFASLLAIAVLDGARGVPTARVALLALIPVNLAVEGLKRSTFRARPDGEHKRSNAAFPSSHAANAAALAWVLARRYRRFALVFGTLAVWVAASRMFLDRHWLTDVVTGLALGWGVSYLVVNVWESRFGRLSR